jgi:hypothetical protein
LGSRFRTVGPFLGLLALFLGVFSGRLQYSSFFCCQLGFSGNRAVGLALSQFKLVLTIWRHPVGLAGHHSGCKAAS